MKKKQKKNFYIISYELFMIFIENFNSKMTNKIFYLTHEKKEQPKISNKNASKIQIKFNY